METTSGLNAASGTPSQRWHFGVPRARKGWLLGLLGLGVLTDLAGVAMGLVMLGFLTRAEQHRATQQEGEALDAVMALVGLGQLAVYITTAVVFCCWFYRVVANAKVLNPSEGPTPGWAVGSFFIPFVNLVRPYQAATYAWKSSAIAAYGSGEKAPGTAVVSAWWAAWIVVSIIGNILLRMAIGDRFTPKTPTIGDLRMTEYVQIAADGGSVVVDLACALLVARLTGLQAKVAARFASVGVPEHQIGPAMAAEDQSPTNE